jgi:hypothetical protein
MLKPLFHCLLLSFPFFLWIESYSQHSDSNTANARMTDSLFSMYKHSIGQGNRFYSGTEYIGYVMRPKGHPFFESDRMQLSEINFEGAVYSDSVLYDLVNDALILKSYDGSYNLHMVDEKVRSFKYLGHLFVRLGTSSDSTNELSPGFYEQLYNGRSAVFVRHKKQLNTTTSQNEILSEYVQYDSYFIRKEGAYYSVSSKKTLLDALREKKPEVRKMLREQGLDFKTDPSSTTRKAVEFFDQINK